MGASDKAGEGGDSSWLGNLMQRSPEVQTAPRKGLMSSKLFFENKKENITTLNATNKLINTKTVSQHSRRELTRLGGCLSSHFQKCWKLCETSRKLKIS